MNQGEKGDPGTNGFMGVPGMPGRDGSKGEKGNSGDNGNTGLCIVQYFSLHKDFIQLHDHKISVKFDHIQCSGIMHLSRKVSN